MEKSIKIIDRRGQPKSRFSQAPTYTPEEAKRTRYDYGKILGSNIVHFYDYGDEFLHFLSKLPTMSPTHSACLTNKQQRVIGDCFFDPFEGSRSSIRSLNETKAIKKKDKRVKLIGKVADNVNKEGHSLMDIFKLTALSHLGIGNTYLQLSRFEVGNKRFFEVYWRDPTYGRVNHRISDDDPKAVFISPCWDNALFLEHGATPFSVYPNWTRHDDGVERCIIHHKNKALGRFFYGLPSFVAAHKEASIENQSGTYNLKSFMDGFMPKVFVMLMKKAGMWSQAEMQSHKQGFKSTYTGQNSDRFLMGFNDAGIEAEVQQLQNKIEGEFGDLKEDVRKDIIAAHNWSATLLDMELKGGGLASGGRKYTETYIVKEAEVIHPLRLELTDVINKVYTERASWLYGDALKDTKLKIKSKLPQTFISSFDINKFLKQNPNEDLAKQVLEIMGLKQ